jgi:hypothetical protein
MPIKSEAAKERNRRTALSRYHAKRDEIRAGRKNRRSSVSGRARSLIWSARQRSKKYGLAFDLTEAWLIDKLLQRCPITGRSFDFTPKVDKTWANPNAPSLDRIDCSKGYTMDNVRVIVAHANYALNQFGIDALIQLCNDILNKARTTPSQALPNGIEGVTTIPSGSTAKRPEARGVSIETVI